MCVPGHVLLALVFVDIGGWHGLCFLLVLPAYEWGSHTADPDTHTYTRELLDGIAVKAPRLMNYIVVFSPWCRSCCSP